MPLWKTPKAAEYMGVTRYFLERDRSESLTIPVVYVGKRSPRYRKQDLDKYIRSQTRHNPDDVEENDDEWEDDILYELDEDDEDEDEEEPP